MTEEAGRARNRVQSGCAPAVTPIADPQTRDLDPKQMSDGHVSRISPTTNLILFSQVSKYFWRFLDIKPKFHRIPVISEPLVLRLSLCRHMTWNQAITRGSARVARVPTGAPLDGLAWLPDSLYRDGRFGLPPTLTQYGHSPSWFPQSHA